MPISHKSCGIESSWKKVGECHKKVVLFDDSRPFLYKAQIKNKPKAQIKNILNKEVVWKLKKFIKNILTAHWTFNSWEW